MSRVRMLLHFGVKPYLVFDGDYLPSKSGTEKSRAARRRESKSTGLELLRMGKTAQAQQELQKSVDVTPEMARQLIDELRRAKVDFIVAPYEADAQLAYLEKKGIIDGILSEDSDLLVFGAKVLVTKLDQYGDCVVIRRDDFTLCKDISMMGWSDAEFRWMAILSGCDYLPGIEKMGLKTAHRFLRKHKTVERLVRAVQFDGKMKVPPDYLDAFKKAEEAFLYQWAFCPTSRELVNLNEPEDGVDVHALPHIGKHVDSDTARKVAQGYLHPHSKELLVPLANVRREPSLRRTVHATPELKKHQSIESFFKPRRTPLAELDPNSFTPSPSQQRLLEQQQQQSWSAEPIVSRPVMTRALTDISRSQPARRAISDMLPSSRSKSPKRQRLCSDTSIALAMGASTMTAKSKFFSPKTFDSPSVARSNRAKVNSQEQINIWSDDSIEEAMSQIPDLSTEQPSQPRSQRFSMFHDVAKSASQSQQADSRTTTSTASSLLSTATSQAETPATETESQSTVSYPNLSASMAELRSKFTFNSQPSPLPSPTDQHEETIPCSSPPQHHNIVSHNHDQEPETDITEEDWASAARAPIKPLPPSLELGLFASNRAANIAKADSCATAARASPTSSRSRTWTAGTPIIFSPSRPQAHKGSEDLLVPDSEGDDEGDVLEEELEKPKFGINLGQFAFTG
ncbi:hypothetical protein MBLNU457_g2764t1 [Dothideomycetes sp. NU457]